MPKTKNATTLALRLLSFGDWVIEIVVTFSPPKSSASVLDIADYVANGLLTLAVSVCKVCY